MQLVPQVHTMIDGLLTLATSWSTDPAAAELVDKLRAHKPKPSKIKTLWRVATNPADGREYYWHVKTKETTYVMPEELRLARAAQQQPATPAHGRPDAAAAPVGAAQPAQPTYAAQQAAPTTPKPAGQHAAVPYGHPGQQATMLSQQYASAY